MNVRTLRLTTQKLREEANDYRELAAKLKNEAETHSQNGDDVKAKLSSDSAERYERDADLKDQEAGVFDRQSIGFQMKAKDIEKQIEAKRAQLEQEIKQLQKEHDSLLGQ